MDSGLNIFAHGEGQINSLSWIQTVQRQFNMFTSSNKSNYICIKKSIKSKESLIRRIFCKSRLIGHLILYSDYASMTRYASGISLVPESKLKVPFKYFRVHVFVDFSVWTSLLMIRNRRKNPFREIARLKVWKSLKSAQILRFESRKNRTDIATSDIFRKYRISNIVLSQNEITRCKLWLYGTHNIMLIWSIICHEVWFLLKWTFMDILWSKYWIRYDLGLECPRSCTWTYGQTIWMVGHFGNRGMLRTLISIRVYKLSPWRFYCLESSPNQPNSFPYNSIQDFLRLELNSRVIIAMQISLWDINLL